MDEPDAERTRRDVERRYFWANDFLFALLFFLIRDEFDVSAFMLLLFVSCLISLTMDDDCVDDDDEEDDGLSRSWVAMSDMGNGRDEAIKSCLSCCCCCSLPPQPPNMWVNDDEAYEARLFEFGWVVVGGFVVEFAGETNGIVVFKLFDDFKKKKLFIFIWIKKRLRKRERERKRKLAKLKLFKYFLV